MEVLSILSVTYIFFGIKLEMKQKISFHFKSSHDLPPPTSYLRVTTPYLHVFHYSQRYKQENCQMTCVTIFPLNIWQLGPWSQRPEQTRLLADGFHLKLCVTSSEPDLHLNGRCVALRQFSSNFSIFFCLAIFVGWLHFVYQCQCVI